MTFSRRLMNFICIPLILEVKTKIMPMQECFWLWHTGHLKSIQYFFTYKGHSFPVTGILSSSILNRTTVYTVSMRLLNNSREQHTSKFVVKVVEAEDTNLTNCGQLTTREQTCLSQEWSKRGVLTEKSGFSISSFICICESSWMHCSIYSYTDRSYRICSDYKSRPVEWTACPSNSVYRIGNVPKYINFSRTFMIKYYHIKRLMNGIWRTSCFWSKLHCISLTGK